MSSNMKLKCVLVFYTLYCQVIKLNFIVTNYVLKVLKYIYITLIYKRPRRWDGALFWIISILTPAHPRDDV